MMISTPPNPKSKSMIQEKEEQTLNEGGCGYTLLMKKQKQKQKQRSPYLEGCSTRILHPRMLLSALTPAERQSVVGGGVLRVLAKTERDFNTGYIMELKWYSSGAMVLRRGWSRLVRDNQLESGDFVACVGHRPGRGAPLGLHFHITKKNPPQQQ